MMRKHLTEETLRRLGQHQLAAAEVSLAMRHLEECAECRALADVGADAARVQDLLAAEAAEPPRHLTFDELAAWVDGTADSAAKQRAEEHLAECDLCRDEAADLARLRETMKPRRTWIWVAVAAAAVILLAFFLTLRWPATPPAQRQPMAGKPVSPPSTKPPQRTTPAPPAYARAEWAQLVASVLASGKLPWPRDLAILRGGPEHVRGEREGKAAKLEPAGIVIDATRPELSWPATEGASYVVSIFDGEQQAAQSAPLSKERWTPPRALPRGRTYTWQVEVNVAGAVEVLPAPPAPPARFRILGAREHDELAAAEAAHPGDPLLLAALYARAGMEREANAQLQKLAGSRDPRLQRLLVNSTAP